MALTEAEAPPRKVTEVGYAVRGCRISDPTQYDKQRAALQSLLDACSDLRADWDLIPEIREQHSLRCEGKPAAVGLGDFGMQLLTEDTYCSWFVYGRFLGEPQAFDLQEGVRAPVLAEVPGT